MEQQLQLTQRFDREVTLAEVNEAVRELITDKNQVAILYAPDKEGLVLPTARPSCPHSHRHIR